MGYLMLPVYSRLCEVRASFMAFVCLRISASSDIVTARKGVEILTCQISCWLHARSKEISSPFADPVNQGYYILENKVLICFSNSYNVFEETSRKQNLKLF